MARLESLQGIVGKSSDRPLYTILLFHIDSVDGTRAFLHRWSMFTPSGEAQQSNDEPALYFLFSWSGIAKLLAGHPTFDANVGRREFEVFFTDPTLAPDGPAVAADLGFLGDSSPHGWWEGKFTTSDIEVAVHCCFSNIAQQTAKLSQIRNSAAASGLQELELNSFVEGALSGALPEGGVLHFGFRDGITSPNVDWADTKSPGSVDLRQFVIGYPSSAYPTMPQKPGPWLDFAKDGCFAGLTWLYQDVAHFNQFLRDNATVVNAAGVAADAEDWLAAKLMGRWRDGSPLARHPTAKPTSADLDDRFGYADDSNGEKCPLTAHIRVVNSRDQGLSPANETRFPDGSPPRLQRRGFSYGPKLDGVDDDAQQRGIVGLFLCARINEQFYTVLRWMQATEFSEVFGNIPNGFRSQDSITGNRNKPNANTQAFIPLSGNRELKIRLANFIKYRGVKTLFVPSMQALTTLSGQWN